MHKLSQRLQKVKVLSRIFILGYNFKSPSAGSEKVEDKGLF